MDVVSIRAALRARKPTVFALLAIERARAARVKTLALKPGEVARRE